MNSFKSYPLVSVGGTASSLSKATVEVLSTSQMVTLWIQLGGKWTIGKDETSLYSDLAPFTAKLQTSMNLLGSCSRLLTVSLFVPFLRDSQSQEHLDWWFMK